MASKIIISLPTAASFQNVVQNVERKHELKRTPSGADSLRTATPMASGSANQTPSTSAKDVFSRMDELQKSITFLKEEQKRMLSSLHQEIASLQAKNRDLLCQLIFSPEQGQDLRNSLTDKDVKCFLQTNGTAKKPTTIRVENNDRSIGNRICENSSAGNLDEICELKYTIDQQQREIEFLKNQLGMVSVRNKAQARESRQVDNYIHEMEDRSREQEKFIRLLRKENKDCKIEIENLRKTISSMRIPNHVPQNVPLTHHMQPQAQLFPAVGTPSNFWYQNRPINLSEYHQLQRTSVSASGGDRTSSNNLTNMPFTLPPVCNYGQITVTAPLPPPPRFFSNTSVPATATGCYYSVAPRPMLRSKTYPTPHSSEGGHGENINEAVMGATMQQQQHHRPSSAYGPGSKV